MDAVKFYSTFKRMCAETDCKDCLLDQKCRPSANVEPEEVVKLVEEWAKEHPVKTRKSEFLKMFPKAEIKYDYLWMCPKYIDYDYKPEGNCYKISCDDCKRKFWLTEVTDND